ncbi:MAG: dynamin family protein [Selenomonadaceae bacterium]|nr:dynamin family protein [Selenomonadaceae bacterium]
MSDWDEHQLQFISKLDGTEQLFKEILEQDPNGLIIDVDKRRALIKLRRSNQHILNKLKSKEFTVAIVGLEKAGKSTLGNALIKSLVLPEYRERCTYTTTEIRAGTVDDAIVSFYSRDEFNDRLKLMFKEIEYPGAVDFSSLTIAAFEKYWQSIEADESKQELYRRHNGKTTEDIKAILSGKAELSALLDRDDETFSADQWTSRDFSIFITGIADEITDANGKVIKVVRKPYPYAVKDVVIHSTRLGDMKNIVLYDVPGFDSPTDLHKKQTLAMLLEADAIILVVNAGTNPNLTSTQLDMLQKHSDEYGVKLSDKAFVFGNRLDILDSPQAAQSNLNTLRNDAAKFDIAADRHVIGGSARAYLENLKLIDGNKSKKAFDDWKMPYGVDELYHQMQEYYDHDRYAVLKKKAEGTLDAAKKFLSELLAEYPPDVLTRVDGGGRYMLQVKNKLRNFIEQSNELIQARLKMVQDATPFSTNLTDKIDKIYPLIEDEYDDLVRQIENRLAIDPDKVYPTTTVNGMVRHRLQVEFVKNIVSEVADSTKGRQAEIRAELVNNFLENMEMPPNSRFRAELEESVNKLFDELLIEGGAKCYFNPLVERFTTTLIEALILSPFAEDERLQKIQLNLPEFLSLAVYYSASSDRIDESKLELTDDPDERLDFFAKLFTHESDQPKAQSTDAPPVEDNIALLRQFFADNKDNFFHGMNIQLNDLPFKMWSDELNDAGITFSNAVRNNFFKTLNTRAKNMEWNRATKAQRIQAMNDSFDEICAAYAQNAPHRSTREGVANSAGRSSKSEPKPPTNQLEALHERGKALKRMSSKADMIATLDADIEILRDITVNAVIKAIGLERAFISIITKNVNLIRNRLDEDEEGQRKLDAWIDRNIHKLKEVEFADLDRVNQSRETRRKIVAAVESALAKL